MPALSWRVEGGSDAVKGKRVVATKTIAPGEVVLQDEPYAFVIHEKDHCDCCCTPPAPLRCAACKQVRYRDREHQAAGWRGGHREECAALRACAPRLPPAPARLALRVALRAWRERDAGSSSSSSSSSGGGGGGSPPASDHAQVLSLRDHWPELPDAAKLRCAQLGALAWRLLQAGCPAAADATTPRELALLVARFGCNSHSISDEELQPLGVGIYPLGALVNHDCRPNALHCFVGPRIVFRAVRPIQPGEEVTTAYVELAATRWERRQALLSQHHFDIDASGEQQAEQAQQQQQQQAPLQVVHLPGGVLLQLYCCDMPPWPHDARDAQLTAWREAGADTSGGAPGAGTAAGSSSTGNAAAAAAAGGGIWGELLLEDESGEVSPEHSFDLAADGDGPGGCEAGPAAAQHVLGGRPYSDANHPSQGAGAATIHCWHGSPEQLQLLAGQLEVLAGRYAAALRLLREVEQAGSCAVAAASARLHAALEGLCPGGATSSGGGGGNSSKGLLPVLGARHVLRMRLLAAAHRAAIAGGQWEAALAHGYQLLPLYQAAYDWAPWPPLGLLWVSLAKLEHLQERPSKALPAAEQALRLLLVTHGSGTGVVEGARRVAREAAAELQQQGAAAATAVAVLGGGGSHQEEDSD